MLERVFALPLDLRPIAELAEASATKKKQLVPQWAILTERDNSHVDVL